MPTFKVKFKVLSSVITPFQSDTIWGHMAWACYYLWGDKKCKDFINSHKDGNPTLVTNAYPEGFMPVPYISLFSREQVEREIFKKVKKKKLMKIENFEKVKDALSPGKLFEILKQEIEEEKRNEKRKEKKLEIAEVAILRNKIDRLTFTTSGIGELFATDEIFYSDDSTMWFALKTEFFNKSELEAILKSIELSGFGADASVGRGKIKFIEISEYNFPEAKDANAFISLSNFIPADGEFSQFEDAWYKTFIKFPKVGGYYALLNPFKKPLLFVEAGSVFKVKELKSYYGCLVENVHSDPDIVQYAYAFPLKVKMEV